MYLKDKKVTLHVRVSKNLLDKLSHKYNEFIKDNKLGMTFSDYIRYLLNSNI